MNRDNPLFAAIAAILVAGCASVPTQTSEQDKTYVTGSRLPTRDGGASADVKSIGNKQDIDDMMQRGRIDMPSKGGGM